MVSLCASETWCHFTNILREAFTSEGPKGAKKKLMTAWASADFFPGKGKIFQGGAKTHYLPKNQIYNYKNILFSSKKLKKHTIFDDRSPSRPPLRTPMLDWFFLHNVDEIHPWLVISALSC
jgi:hypothetical protein